MLLLRYRRRTFARVRSKVNRLAVSRGKNIHNTTIYSKFNTGSGGLGLNSHEAVGGASLGEPDFVKGRTSGPAASQNPVRMLLYLVGSLAAQVALPLGQMGQRGVTEQAVNGVLHRLPDFLLSA